MSNKGDKKDWARLVECKYDAISRGSLGRKSPSPLFSAALISGRKWWPPKAVENFRGADGYDGWCSAGVTRSYLLPLPVEPMFQSATTTNPFFQTLAKRRFQRNFSRAERCYLLLRPSRNTVGKIERFFEISKHTSGSPLTSTPREKSFLLCNFEFSRIFSSLLREIFFER